MPQSKSQRTAYGETLVALGAENEKIVVLEADLSKSTMGTLFEQAYPDRFFEMGIAEANMASTAAGLALTGKIPFFASFAVFSTGRCYDQIRTSICIPKLNVKICGSSAGLSDYGDGSTHQSIDDISLMRVLPNMQVFVPADAAQTRTIVRYMAQHEGPMYLRLNRNDLPAVTEPDAPFTPGALQVLRQGRDAIVFAAGVMVSRALEAAELLAREGISLQVVNVPSIKPLDSEQLITLCRPFSAIVTAEEHSVSGGLGSAILEALTPVLPRRVLRLGVENQFGTSAQDYETLLRHYGLTAQAVADKVRAALA